GHFVCVAVSTAADACRAWLPIEPTAMETCAEGTATSQSGSELGRLVQLAADRTARKRRRVVVNVVRARVLAQVGAGRAGIWRRGAALLDVARARRRGWRDEQRHHDRAR